VDKDGLEITTWEGLYGNEESRLILALPHSKVITAEYARPLLKSGIGYCRVSYLSETGAEGTLKFSIIDPVTFYHQNSYTEAITRALVDLKQGRPILPPFQSVPTLKPPKAGIKFLYGLSLFAVPLIMGALAYDSVFLLLLGSMVFFPSVAALGVDFIRLHTGWHPAVKVVVSIVIFCVAFILFVITMGLLEVFNLI